MSGTEGDAPEPRAIEVGDTVRLTNGSTITVQGVRRSPDGTMLMGAGCGWLDGAGAVVIEG